MEKVVVSLGGSIIIPDERDGEFLSKFAAVLSQLSEEFELYVVCGGGKIARYYIVTGREIEATEDELDDMGIQVTRINARLVQLALRNRGIQTMPATVEEAASLGGKGKVVIMGGTTPGHTTDGVSAALAEKVGAARIVNATSVDGVYSADPQKDKGAKKYDRISFRQLREMLGGKHGAGSSHVFDPMGAEIVMRNKIPVLVVAGRDLVDMEKAVRGQKIDGTVIDG